MFSMKTNKEQKNIDFHFVIKAIGVCLITVIMFGALIMWFQYNADFSFGVSEAFQISFHLEKDGAEDGTSAVPPKEEDADQSNE